MAAPNILSVSNITGKTTSNVMSNTSVFLLIENAVSSNTVIKINTILISNYSNTNANVAIGLYSNASLAGTATPMANNITIPSGATLVFLDKGSSIYLEENKSIGSYASVGNTLSIICSYEVIQ